MIALLLTISSCKSEFELVRTSNDSEKIYNKALQYFEAKDYAKAQSLLELSIPNYRGKEEAENLYYKYAQTYYELGEYILAAHYFNRFTTTFYNSDKKEDAEFMAAYSNYKLSPNSKLDQTYTQKAIEGFQKFVNTYPRSPRVEECNTLIDDMGAKLELKAFQEGKLYYDLKRYQSAVQSFKNMLLQYPESERAEEVRFLMLKSSYELASNSVYEKKLERYQETISQYNKFKKKHPRSDYNDEAYVILKNTETEIKKLKA